MKHTLRSLVLGGAMLASASIANAQQVTLLDSLTTSGGNLGTNVNLSALGGPVVGYDPNSTTTGANAPSTNIADSGFVVVPFTMAAGANYNLSTISFEGAYDKAKDTAFNTDGASNAQLYAAIVSTSSVTSGSLNGATPIGGFFALTNANSPNIASGTEIGNGTLYNDAHNNIFTGTANANTALVGGQSYFLVIAPINSFSGTSSADAGNVLEYAVVNGYNTGTGTTHSLPGGSSSLSGPDATEAALLSEKLGANTGDTLSQPSYSGLTGTAYAAVQLTGVAGVPESSTAVIALLGLAPVGGLWLRRRRTR